MNILQIIAYPRNPIIKFARQYRKSLTALLVLTWLTGCQPQPSPFKLEFLPVFKGQPLTCLQNVTLANDNWQFSQLQFYIFDLEWQDQSQNWQKLLTQSTQPANNYATIGDLQLIGEVCESTQPLNANAWTANILSSVAIEQIQSIRFKIGVPFDLNHQPPLTMPVPLNQPDMFWSWQTGHKFLRLELNHPEGGFVYHLGSTGCSSASPVRAPQTACKNPNLAQVEMTQFKKGARIAFEIDKLLENIALDPSASCQSDPDSTLCDQLLARTGVDSTSQIISWLP